MTGAYSNTPLVAVAALIWREDVQRVLLIQRGREPNKGFWALPGGKVEIGERLVDALAREVREECGIEVDPGPLVAIFEPIFHDDAGLVQYHYVVLDFLAFYRGGTPRAGDDAISVGWFSPDELDNLQMLEETRGVIARGIAMTAEKTEHRLRL